MLVIDAYNVLQTEGVLSPDLAGPDVQELAELILSSRYARERIVLVCDGTAHARHGRRPDRRAQGVERATRSDRPGRASVVYSGRGREADDVIEDIISKRRHGGGKSPLLVISSDGRLRAAARRARVRWMRSETFLSHLDHDAKRPRQARASARPAFAESLPLDQYSVEQWMREFGYEPLSRTPARTTESGAPTKRGPLEPGKNARAKPGAEPRVRQPDPLIDEAMRMWPGRVHPDDLDMARWVKD